MEVDEIKAYNTVVYDVLDAQREELARIRHENAFDDAVVRKVQTKLDIDEAAVLVR